MARKVFLPQKFADMLYALTELQQESDGILLYRQQDDNCPVEGIYVTGVGTEGHVQAHPDRIKVANKFFERHPDYKYIKFHTHTRGTIEQYGQYYARHFSSGDIDGIQEQLRDNREFIAMLITPETRLLSGIDNPRLETVEGSREYDECERFINESIAEIAREMGVAHEAFRGTRRR